MSQAKIAVVEDEIIVAMEIEDRLIALGYDVVGTYASGEEILKEIDKVTPDLILMDIILKGDLDGIETARKIRDHYKIPIVYLTANSDEATLNRAKVTGPYGYLLKPFEERELLIAVEMAFYKSQMERKLIEKEMWLSTTLKSIGDAIIATDENGGIRFMNPVAEKLTGWNQEDAFGLDSSEVFHIVNEKTGQEIASPIQRAFQTRQTVALANHTVLISRDGRRIPIEDSAAPIMNDKGKILGIVLDFRDVSDRKKSETALRNSEKKFKSIFQASYDAILISNFEGKILSCNRAAQKVFDFSEEELLTQSIPHLIPGIAAYFSQKGATPLNPKNIEQLIGKALEIVGKKSDETEFPIDLSITDWETEEGRFLSFTIRDITERKQAEEALRTERDFISTVMNTDGVLVIVLDSFGNFVRGNRTWETLTGYDKEKVQNKKFELFLRSEVEIKQYRAVLNRIYEGEGIGKEEIPLTTKEGETRQILWSYSTIRNEGGGIDFIVGTGLDITELRKAEEQLRQAQKMDAIGKLAGGVAHDFNNLLTAINGYSDLMLETMDPSEEYYEDIKEIRKAGNRAADLTRQLLAFSRRQMLNMRILNLNDVLQNMDKMLRRIIGEHISLNYLFSDRPAFIRGDASQIDQIVLNLAVNARDAMPNGGKLTIETDLVTLDKGYSNKHFQMKPGEYVLLAISDNGIGMSKEVQKRIFEPFFTTKEIGKGTGLGLSTVYGIVKQSNGFIWVYSEPGQGTTFKIYLPRAEQKEKQHSQFDEFQATYSGAETILLVEDEKFVRDFVARILEKNGYKTILARDAMEALRLVDEEVESFDLLLTDVVMPELSGKELEGYLREKGLEFKTLFMSGYTDKAIVSHGILNEDIQFIQKPFAPGALLKKLRKILDADTIPGYPEPDMQIGQRPTPKRL